MAELNRRFEHGQPSSELSDAGVLIRQFDRLSAVDLLPPAPWRPCPLTFPGRPGSWCAPYHAQWPASIINTKLRQMYYDSSSSPGDVRGGMVLDPSLLEFYCFYPRDGNSMGHHCDGGYGDCPGPSVPMSVHSYTPATIISLHGWS